MDILPRATATSVAVMVWPPKHRASLVRRCPTLCGPTVQIDPGSPLSWVT